MFYINHVKTCATGHMFDIGNSGGDRLKDIRMLFMPRNRQIAENFVTGVRALTNPQVEREGNPKLKQRRL